MIKPPSRTDLVDQFIDMWKNRKDNDIDAREAYRFWKLNQNEIEHDCQISNPYSYSKKVHSDGEPMELSAIHSYYVRVAKYGPKAVATEIDNDPPEDASAKGIGLTVQVVSSRLNGLAKRQLPANTVTLTAAIDLGKYYCHWAVVAWWQGAGGCVVDYGAKQVLGTDNTQDHYAAEPHIFDALLDWREQILQTNYTDASGIVRKVDLCFVDSGAFTNCAYKFCIDVGRPFFPSKGIANYKKKKADTNRLFVGDNLHCEYLPAHKVALYELDTDYWKQFIHERFMTSTFDENNMLRRGALSLYHTEKKHTMYAEHICAEEYVSEFVEGKGSKQYWNKRRDDNHWLDATYMAAAAAEVYGVKLLSSSEAEIVARQTNPAAEKQSQVRRPQQHGQANRFRTRPGGWIPRRR
jgi:phage terminase large subunit GpA-like protein